MTKAKYKFFHIIDTLGDGESYEVINNRDKTSIGTIQYYPPWKMLCFFPVSNSVWSASCLADIQTFMKTRGN